MLTQIINARILTPQGWLKDGSVLIRDNKILEVTNCDLAIIGAKLIDAKGMYIVPGGVEIHVHGGGGRDFMEGTEEAFRVAVKAHMQHGTTSIFPTLSSSTIPMIRAAAETTEKMMVEPDTGTCRLLSNDEGRACFFTDICIHWKCSFTVCFSESWRKKNQTYQKRISGCVGVGCVLCDHRIYSN